MSYFTRCIRSTAILALLTYASLSAVWGQATTSLRGIVSDSQGGAVDSANATLQNDQTGFKRSVITDATGAYQFLQVPPGAYTVTIEKPGFSVSTQQGVQLLVNTPATLNVALQLASISSSVNVEAEVVTLNTVDAAIGNAFNQTQVRELPLQTRNVVELLSLQPGVTQTGEVLGSRRDQNNITLDGVDANDNQNANPRQRTVRRTDQARHVATDRGNEETHQYDVDHAADDECGQMSAETTGRSEIAEQPPDRQHTNQRGKPNNPNRNIAFGNW